ncbi:hypothetical protein MASR1M46_20000 [Bacteroidales bacterium]
MSEWFAKQRVKWYDVQSVDRLCYVGKRGMGALEFEPAQNNPQLEESSVIEIAHLTNLAKRVLGKREDFQVRDCQRR